MAKVDRVEGKYGVTLTLVPRRGETPKDKRSLLIEVRYIMSPSVMVELEEQQANDLLFALQAAIVQVWHES
jgi:hypothetical protein